MKIAKNIAKTNDDRINTGTTELATHFHLYPATATYSFWRIVQFGDEMANGCEYL